MKLLMHLCCGPCTIYPLKILRIQGHEVSGVFYNPNIHPYQEYQRRHQTLSEYAEKSFLNIIWPDGYPMEEFFRQVVFKENERCEYCYWERLRHTAELALQGKYEAFTSTLLYSKYQKHEAIKEIGENLGKQLGIKFYYHDFREGWDEGVKISRELGMYRQKYCGCLYSEKERFCK